MYIVYIMDLKVVYAFMQTKPITERNTLTIDNTQTTMLQLDHSKLT